MTVRTLHDEYVEIDDPCAEEDLHELSEGDLEMLYTRDFVSLLANVEGQMAVAELAEPLPVSNIALNKIVALVKTNDVISANAVCRFKFILECQPWTSDFETAVSVWFNKLLDVLRALEPRQRQTLLDPDADIRLIRTALIQSGALSSAGSLEL